MENVGLGYLALGRSAKTLSGGESQRIRLAAQLGSNLRGVLYVLDEPTIGLHPRDNLRLLDTLTALREKGNSLVIVEHDEETMRHADHIVDLGPRAGLHGGEIVAQGTLRDIEETTNSETGRCLRLAICHPIRKTTRSTPGTYIKVVDEIRNLYAQLPVSRVRGYSASRFSFNAEGGRCETCKGQGVIKLEMNFLPSSYVPCEDCGSRRYNPQ